MDGGDHLLRMASMKPYPLHPYSNTNNSNNNNINKIISNSNNSNIHNNINTSNNNNINNTVIVSAASISSSLSLRFRFPSLNQSETLHIPIDPC